MEAKEKATVAANVLSRGCSKGSDSSGIKAIVKSLFLYGRKLTAKEINAITGSNDARKTISILRRGGMRIRDERQIDRCKLYWYEPKERQLELFKDEEAQ